MAARISCNWGAVSPWAGANFDFVFAAMFGGKRVDDECDVHVLPQVDDFWCWLRVRFGKVCMDFLIRDFSFRSESRSTTCSLYVGQGEETRFRLDKVVPKASGCSEIGRASCRERV